MGDGGLDGSPGELLREFGRHVHLFRPLRRRGEVVWVIGLEGRVSGLMRWVGSSDVAYPESTDCIKWTEDVLDAV